MSTVISFSKNYDINIEQRVYMMRIVFGKVLLKKKGEKIMTKRFGFTLAEVLITLGIIGVVAAMTMPTLMNQTNGAQYKAAYKKALSAISQAVTLNVALDDVSFAETEAASATTANADKKTNTADILRTRMNVVKSDATAGYTFPGTVSAKVCVDGNGAVKTCGEDETPTAHDVTPDLYLFFNDGSMFAFNKADTGCTNVASQSGGTDKPCYGVIDVNGAKGPNKVVQCDTKAAGDTSDTCTVTSPTDIYPVVYYDQTILPASAAAKAVLYGK